MGWADGGPGLDYTINSAVGVPQMTGSAEDPRPTNHVLPAWDLLTGAYAAFSLVSALMDRRATGKGREIRIPLSDIAATSLANLGWTAEAGLTGHQRPRLGNDLYGAFGRDFVTRDGKPIMLVAITPRQWSGVLETLGLTASVAALEGELGVSFARDEGLRFDHRDRLFPLFEQALGAVDLAEVVPSFDALGVCWGPYQPLEKALDDPRLYAGNPVFSDLTHPSGERYPAPGFAGTLPHDTRQPARPAPALGQHTDEVLADVLGMDSGEIARLHAAGVVA